MSSRHTLVIADDFTGAMDAGVKFLPTGTVAVVLDADRLEIDAPGAGALTHSDDIIVVDTESRHLDPARARERIRHICSSTVLESSTTIFKKIDSTLRGNVGAEIDEVMETFGITLTCLAPAAPEQGRVVKDGLCYVRGVPLHESESGNDPIYPVASPLIAEIVGVQSARETALLPLDATRAGTDAAAAHIRGEIDRGAQIVIADAETDNDLKIVAEAFRAIDEPVVFAGSSGLAKALAATAKAFANPGITSDAEALALAGEIPGAGTTGQILMVIGSLMVTVTQQLAFFRRRFPAAPVVAFCGSDLADIPDEYGRRFRKRCDRAFRQDDVWVVATDPDRTGDDDSIQRANDIALRVGEVVAGIVADRGVGTLVLTGGTTAYYVARALDIRAISIVGEIRPGLVLGVGRSGVVGREMNLVTKGGGFGEVGAFVEIVEFFADQEGGRR